MRTLFSRHLAPFIAALAFAACDVVPHEPDEATAFQANEPDRELLVQHNLVGMLEARELAEEFAADSFGGDKHIGASDVEFDRETHEPAIYIFNFEGGGFVLVSADRRQIPILGYSETNSFDVAGLSSGSAPEGVRGFITKTRTLTRDIRSGAAKSPVPGWGSNQPGAPGGTGTIEIELPDPNTCDNSYSYTWDLNFPMKWNQGCGWNDHAPTASNGPCGRAWAGCVAVAIGQVMKYYQYPATFNWGGMDNTEASLSAAWLLREIGDEIDMDWGGDGSSADTADVDNVLEGYGYSTSASFQNHSFYTVKAELEAGRPVIMRGAPDCDFLGIPTCGGHAWVVTGVKDTYNCVTQSYPRYYNMNWGWGGSYDGWYATHDITPGSDNYNHHQKVVVGIKL